MSGDHTESMGDELACRRPLQSGGRAAVAFAGIREGLHPDRALLRDALKTQEPARAQAFVAALGSPG